MPPTSRKGAADIVKGSTATAISPRWPATASNAVVSADHAPSPTIARLAIRPPARATSTTGITARGSTVVIVRPGNHQPIIVITTNVAMPSCTAIRPATTRAAPRRRQASTHPGTARRSSGAQRPMPKRRSTKSPQMRYTRSTNDTCSATISEVEPPA